MLLDQITLVDGSYITNATIQSGTSFPAAANEGELFCITGVGIYAYVNSAWNLLESSGAVDTLVAAKVTKSGDTMTGALILNADPVTNLGAATKQYVDTKTTISDGSITNTMLANSAVANLSGTNTGDNAANTTYANDYRAANFVAGTNYVAPGGALGTPSSGTLTNCTFPILNQNTTGTAANATQLNGVSASGYQLALGYTPVNKAGDSITGNLVFDGIHTITNLPAPVNTGDVTNKGYVDALVTGLTWTSPVQLSNLIGTATSPIGSPVVRDGYIIGTGGNTGAWSSFSVGDVVQYQDTGWVKIKAAASGDRFGVSFSSTTTAVGDAAGKDDYIGQISGGSAGAWTWTWIAPVANQAVFVENPAAYSFGRSYVYLSSSSSWVVFSGPSATGAGVGLAYAGNTLNIQLGAGIAELPTDEVGVDLYPSGGLFLTTNGSTASTSAAAQLAVKVSDLSGTATSLSIGGNAATVTTNANLTGDVTSVGNATTLATVNSNVGSFGSATNIPVVTVNGKGLVTAVSTVGVSIPSGSISVTGGDLTLSGTTGTAITNATLATVTQGSTGTSFVKIALDTKGRVTSNTAVVQSDITGLLGAGSITNTMLANSAVANLSGTNTGDQTTITGNAGTATSVAGGEANQLVYQTGFGSSSFVTAPVSASTYLYWTGSAFAWGTVSSGTSVTITDDLSTNTSEYLTCARATSGSMSSIYTASTKLYFNPSTGTLNATVFNSLSDQSQKENVTTIASAVDTVTQLRGVEFDWVDTKQKSAGIIAQELSQILPHLTSVNDNGMMSVNYNGIIGYLIEAVKELSDKINQLEAK
jgi:hypothetical protein